MDIIQYYFILIVRIVLALAVRNSFHWPNIHSDVFLPKNNEAKGGQMFPPPHPHSISTTSFCVVLVKSQLVFLFSSPVR